VEPTLVVIGVNSLTAAVDVRERFWVSEARRSQALKHLAKAEGIEEVAILTTCDRIEFFVWADEPALAANSVLRFLSSEYGLQLCEWKHFYRILDEAALLHTFRVAAGLDSAAVGESQVQSKLQEAWTLSQKSLASGRCLDALFRKASDVARRVRHETSLGHAGAQLPQAVCEIIKHHFGSLSAAKIMILGAGRMAERNLRYLVKHEATNIRVLNRTFEHAIALADKVAGTAVPFEDRMREMEDADVVISSTSSSSLLLTREEAARLATQRKGRRLCFIDLAIPRNADPAIREINGMLLYDLDDLEKTAQHHPAVEEEVLKAESIVNEEAREFRCKLQAEHMVPTIVALREPLSRICVLELELFRRECGPFPKDQEDLLVLLSSRIAQRIAGALAQEFRELPEKVQRENIAQAVKCLLDLKASEAELAGTRI
jgi:glutamyl-tRNA reductase